MNTKYGLTVRPSGSQLFRRAQRGLIADAVIIFALCWLAYVVLLRYAPYLGVALDTFTVSYLVHLGLTEPFSWFPVKAPGRPLASLSWWLSAELSGGSVLGFNLATLLSHLGAMLLVYLLARRLGASRTLSLLAAGFRLAWTFNHGLYLNHSLNIFFAECCMLVAVLAFLYLVQPRMSRAPIYKTALTALFGALALVIPIATYQPFWPLLAALPLALMFLGLIPRRGGRVWIGLIGWYVVFFATALVSIWHMLYWPGSQTDKIFSLTEITSNILIGIRDTFVISALVPIKYIVDNFSIHSAVLTGLGLFPLLLAALLTRRDMAGSTGIVTPTANESGSGNDTVPSVTNYHGRILIVGIVAAVLPLLPASLGRFLEYGSRFGHLSVYGWTICLLVIWRLLVASGWRTIRVSATGVVLVLLVSGTYLRVTQMESVTLRFAKKSVFQMQTIHQLGNLKEGSVVALSGVPDNTSAEVQSWFVRMFSDTVASSVVINPRIRRDPLEPARFVILTTTTNFEKDHHFEYAQRFEWLSRFHWALVRRPSFTHTGEARDYRIPLERLVAISWSPTFHRYTESEHFRAPPEAGGSSASDYARKLYPQYMKWSKGSFVDSNRYIVLSACGIEPDHYRQLRRYPQTCPLVITQKSHAVSADKISIPATIHVYVPKGDILDIKIAPDDSYEGPFTLVRLPDGAVLEREVHPSYTRVRLGAGIHALRIPRVQGSSQPVTASISVNQ